LTQKPKNLTLVELDADMIHILELRIAAQEVQIPEEIDFSIQKIDVLKYSPSNEKYSIIANIPYYITSPIFFHFLYEVERTPEEMVILLQRDVGDKIRKTKGNTASVLSLFIDLACDRIEEVCTVKASCFVPAPKVESAVLRFTVKPEYDKTEALKILEIIKIGFAERRKKLLSNLEKGLKIEKNKLREIFSEIGLGENTRAEELEVEHWKKMKQLLTKNDLFS
jgi:16S rRNA (adenine1518-N6/adenine1519-N6)-dimethyltransferase